MNFVKPRKHLEDKDAKEPVDKGRRYQRSDSARLLLQVIVGQGNKTSQTENGSSLPQNGGAAGESRRLVGSVGSKADFKPEELPDGAFFRLKSDLRNVSVPAHPTQDSDGAGSKVIEFIRPAQYIGTFSVSGNNKEARERQMEQQLEQMRTAKDRMPVNVVITNSAVKVLHEDNNTVFMEHSLKRIWYATCDPQYCQFSFLAREPKTSAEVQYCHTFVTQTAPQAEELIAAIGEAFKSTDISETKKAPTFNELIQQQVQQQQAKFRETEKEAQTALQQKLKEIATPTPFSEKAQFRMEQRRQSDDILPLPLDQPGGTPSINCSKSSNNFPGNRRSEIPTRQSTPISSPLKRNSVPAQAAMMSDTVPSSLATNPLSILAIKESMESRSSNTKFKGSPVTALKNEIDRRLSIPNVESLPLPNAMDKNAKTSQAKPPKQQPKSMSNRPLPLPPGASNSPQQSRRQSTQQHQLVQQSHPTQLHNSPHPQPTSALHRHSLDDNHLPRSSSSHIPLSSNASNKSSNPVLRNSPNRRPTRPLSEIATSSSSSTGPGNLRVFSNQQDTLLNNFTAGFYLSSHPEAGDGMSTHGPGIQEPGKLNDPSSSQPKRHPYVHESRQSETGECLNKSESTRQFDTSRAQSEGIRILDSNHQQSIQNKMQINSSKQGKSTQSLRRGSVANKKAANVTGLKPQNNSQYQNDEPYQNDKPYQNDDIDASPYRPSGFESFMSLDRSHIQDETLRSAVWYQAGLPREIALNILQQEEVGAFIVRDSSSHPGCYALSARVPKYENTSGISHYLILRTQHGVKLKGLEKEWSNLTALVTHHTVMRELLPCTLRLPKVKVQALPT